MARQLALAVRTAMKGPSLRIVGEASGVAPCGSAHVLLDGFRGHAHVGQREGPLAQRVDERAIRLAREYINLRMVAHTFPQIAPRLAQLTSRPRRFPGRGGTPRVSPAENGRVAAAHAP